MLSNSESEIGLETWNGAGEHVLLHLLLHGELFFQLVVSFTVKIFLILSLRASFKILLHVGHLSVKEVDVADLVELGLDEVFLSALLS